MMDELKWKCAYCETVFEDDDDEATFADLIPILDRHYEKECSTHEPPERYRLMLGCPVAEGAA